MKASLMGIEVSAAVFLVVAILIVIAQLSVWKLARYAGLIEGVSRTVWTKGRLAACVSMVIFSCLALIFGFLALMSSFVEQWQVLWPTAAVLALAGLLGLATVPRFLFK